MMPRAWHRLRAWWGHYFWLPCDVCGRYFGGHERGGGEILVAQTRGKVTCPRCPGQWYMHAGLYRQAQAIIGPDGKLVVALFSWPK